MARRPKQAAATSTKPRPPEPPDDSQRRPFDVEVRIDNIVVHRSPARVTRSLRYLLASTELPNRFSLTSAIRGEGVTSLSRGLAALIANDWRSTTCWVDLNWWKSPGQNVDQGLFPVTVADAVLGNAAPGALPTPTSIPGLAMVTAGEVPVSSRFQLPHSDRLANVIVELSRQFDFVVLDLPPVLARSDALPLSALTEGYFLVVRQRATTTAQVGAALQAMNAVPCLGTILNGARTRVPTGLRTSNEIWTLGDG